MSTTQIEKEAKYDYMWFELFWEFPRLRNPTRARAELERSRLNLGAHLMQRIFIVDRRDDPIDRRASILEKIE